MVYVILTKEKTTVSIFMETGKHQIVLKKLCSTKGHYKLNHTVATVWLIHRGLGLLMGFVDTDKIKEYLQTYIWKSDHWTWV